MLSTKLKIVIATLVQRVINIFYNDVSNICVFRKGLYWNLNLKEGIDFSIFMFGYFEKETTKVLDRLLRKGHVVIDIGANIGAHTMHMAQIVGDEGKVYAVEPTNYALNKLENNIAINPAISSRIVVKHLLLVSKHNISKKISGIYSSWPLESVKGKHHVHCGVKMSISGVEKNTLDNMVLGQKITKIDVIKLDVDGNELDVLIGGQKSIIKFKPVFVMELAPDQYEKNSDFDKTIQLMSSMGYEFYPLNEVTKYPDDSTLLRNLIPDMGSINIIAKIKV
jgi:FkbM family methyltransferase